MADFRIRKRDNNPVDNYADEVERQIRFEKELQTNATNNPNNYCKKCGEWWNECTCHKIVKHVK